MKKTIALIGLLLMGATPVWADDVPPCPVPDGVQIRSVPDQIPQPLLRALTERYGSFARAGEDFYATDAHLPNKNLSSRRVVFVWERGSRWVFATEHGGFVYNDPILVYDFDAQTSRATLLEEEVESIPTICDTARKWVGGKPNEQAPRSTAPLAPLRPSH